MRRTAVSAVWIGLAVGSAIGVEARAASLTVEVEGVSPGAGEVLVSLCEGGLEERDCRFGQSQPARAPSQRFAFPGLPEGSYAVAAFQDLNGNRRLDRDRLGLPLEPYGFSNGVGRTAPPSYNGARIAVRGALGATVRLDRLPR